MMRTLACLLQGEGRVAVGEHIESVRAYPQRPAVHPHHKVEETVRKPAGEKNGEPSHHERQHGSDAQHKQHDVVGDGEQPLNQRKPSIQGRGVVHLQMDCLCLGEVG
jgi:hypothetical protein